MVREHLSAFMGIRQTLRLPVLAPTHLPSPCTCVLTFTKTQNEGFQPKRVWNTRWCCWLVFPLDKVPWPPTWPTIRVRGTSTVLPTHAEKTSCRPVRNELCGGKQFWKCQPKTEGSASNVRPTEDAVCACLWRNTKLSFAIRPSRRLFPSLAFTGEKWRLLITARSPSFDMSELKAHCSELN